MRFHFLAAFLLGVRSEWSSGDLGVSNNGRNISTQALPTNSSLDCYNACLALATCVAWEIKFATPTCGSQAQCTLKSNFGGDGADDYLGATNPCSLNPCVASGPVERDPTPLLRPLAFIPASLSGVNPGGWLAEELLTQASTGQSGQLALFWGPVANSIWRGGEHNTDDGYLHEDLPYFLNGVVPLTLLLGNMGLPDVHNISGQVSTLISEILAGQNASGWLGPDDTHSGDEYWARFNVLSSFVQYAEGYPELAPTLLPAAFRYIREAMRRCLTVPGYQINDWSAARAHDYLITLHYLLDNFTRLQAKGLVPDGVSQATLYNAAAVAHAQALGNGARWEDYFASPTFPNSTVTQNFGMLTHGVNVAQAIKTAGVWYRQQPNASLYASTLQRIAVLDLYHGSPSGVVQADEHLAGKEPQHGTEMCGIVEAMYSYETLGDIHGDVSFFDRVEMISYNALPASATTNFSSHNYLSQANEIMSQVVAEKVWLTDGGEATVYGLAPNYQCCSSNHHQGWPKLAARLHKVHPASGGVAVTIWAPGTTMLTLPGSGARVALKVDTTYPFGDRATVNVTAPPSTPILLRIPGWATNASVCVVGGGGGGGGCTHPSNGTFYTTTTSSQSTTTTFTVDFAPEIRVDASFSGQAGAVYRGALLYALQLKEDITIATPQPQGFNSYKITTTTPWNVALSLKSLAFSRVSDTPPSPNPFSPTPPTQMITGVGYTLGGWGVVNNSATTPPLSPIDCTVAGVCGGQVGVTLVPYGTTLLRMAVLPWVKE